MKDSIVQLYPVPAKDVPLASLYLRHNLHECHRQIGRAYVYTNFITSLDGRIAVPNPSGAGMKVPDSITNSRDWRLFQELVVQADVLITTGRYLRDYQAGIAQEILQVYDDPHFSDLKEWRIAKGLPQFPDLAIISKSLDFPIPDAISDGERKIHILTTQDANPERVNQLQQSSANLFVAGQTQVDGQELVDQLTKLGYRTIYSTSGPKVFHMLLSASVVDRLYLTYTGRILGGQPYSSIVEGGLLQPNVDFRLKSLYLDPHGLEGLGQLFSCYDRARLE